MDTNKKYDRHHHHHKRRSPHKTSSRHYHKHRSNSPKPARRRSRDRSPIHSKPPHSPQSEKQSKIKGRGSQLDTGLRSWTDTQTSKPIQDSVTDSKPDEEFYRLNEKWVSPDKKEFESGHSKKIKLAPKWEHDKFEKLLRDYESEQRQNEIKFKKSEASKVCKKESPNWQHDKFESVIRDSDPYYQYMVRLSPPIHEEAI